MELISNVINNDHLSDLYIQILEDLGNILERSYGPYGSNSLIQKGQNAFPIYTKDGHTILSNVRYHNIIEKTITSNILSITEYIVKGTTGVGDGTTSAVLLARNILRNLINLQKAYKDKNLYIAPIQIVRTFQKIVAEMCKTIRENGRPFKLSDAKNISLISTNGDVDIANEIMNLYESLGKEVYISLNTTSQKNDIVSIYDGLILESGIIEEAYINNPEDKTCVLNRPRIYAFIDPIDTPEMINYFDTIVNNNIYEPILYQTGKLTAKKDENGNDLPFEHTEVIPTVIITPKISRDASALMEHITRVMENFTGASVRKRPPILVITNLGEVDQDQYGDIMQMCGCPAIKKYIDPRIQAQDQASGTAPTMETVDKFFGSAELVKSDQYKTSFINPQDMMKAVKTLEGEVNLIKSDKYNSLVAFLEEEIRKAYENKLDYVKIHHLKKRLNSLKAAFVEWYVGGVSPADRDQRSATIDDAVRNCRSAAADGVGYGANIEGFRAISNYVPEQDNDFEDDIVDCIKRAYFDVIRLLYKEYATLNNLDVDKLVSSMVDKEPPNATGENYPVLSSISSDIMILEGISNLITIMATSNQYICPEPIDTTPYRADENIRKRKEEEIRKQNNMVG